MKIKVKAYSPKYDLWLSNTKQFYILCEMQHNSKPTDQRDMGSFFDEVFKRQGNNYEKTT